MVCSSCSSELDSDCELCPTCGARAERDVAIDTAPASMGASTTLPSASLSALGVSVVALVLYLVVPYVSIQTLSITGWQLNWLPSWQFWPPSGRWMCISLTVLVMVSVLNCVVNSSVKAKTVFAITQLIVSAYLFAAMIRLFFTIASRYFGDLITPWIIVIAAIALFSFATVQLFQLAALQHPAPRESETLTPPTDS